jgi:hypothetical protein
VDLAGDGAGGGWRRCTVAGHDRADADEDDDTDAERPKEAPAPRTALVTEHGRMYSTARSRSLAAAIDPRR